MTPLKTVISSTYSIYHTLHIFIIILNLLHIFPTNFTIVHKWYHYWLNHHLSFNGQKLIGCVCLNVIVAIKILLLLYKRYWSWFPINSLIHIHTWITTILIPYVLFPLKIVGQYFTNIHVPNTTLNDKFSFKCIEKTQMYELLLFKL